MPKTHLEVITKVAPLTRIFGKSLPAKTLMPSWFLHQIIGTCRWVFWRPKPKTHQLRKTLEYECSSGTWAGWRPQKYGHAGVPWWIGPIVSFVPYAAKSGGRIGQKRQNRKIAENRDRISVGSDPVPSQADMPIPKELNYDMWLGPMQYVPYTDMRVHTPYDILKRPNWMRVDTYAQGMIANWGAHYFDMAQWANNSEYSGPIEVEGKGEFPKSLWNTMINFQITYRYANGVELTCLQSPTSRPSIKYIGSEGWIHVENYPVN